MNARIPAILGISALCLGIAMVPAKAAESRTSNFSFTCDGTNQHLTLTASGLGNSTTRFIQGSAIALFQNSGGLQYILLTANDVQKLLLNMGIGKNSASEQYQGFIPVTTSATGTVTISVDGACNPGAGQIQGNAIVWFF